jgi:hypothetical protein
MNNMTNPYLGGPFAGNPYLNQGFPSMMPQASSFPMFGAMQTPAPAASSGFPMLPFMSQPTPAPAPSAMPMLPFLGQPAAAQPPAQPTMPFFGAPAPQPAPTPAASAPMDPMGWIKFLPFPPAKP